ncbi:MAG: hypothetical protein COT36_01240 [Parcubacteria group bacterium CG08_land_8_20_14_0_20_38_56]|nr:MAG: hypothetical protein COT36_01240 [Parcubacteria group bacterium CG08_land_8_20_14_0_20_38_56]
MLTFFNTMSYKDHINKIASQISPSILNLCAVRKKGNPPTQAFSDFLTHNEQGDWAETLLFKALQKVELPFVPVRYGKADKIIAGDPNFKTFYNAYQNELSSIGKRPDILLFNKKSYKKEWGDDISKFSRAKLLKIIPSAVAGFEVRSSAYLTKKFISKKERPFLSFTPKVEDIIVVLKWINIFNVSHFYVQVFFDAIYIISFEEILNLLRTAKIEEKGVKNKKITGFKKGKLAFVVEKNPKNQYKETIHIFLSNGHLLSKRLSEPKLIGSRKELSGGRLLHYVSFEGGEAKLNTAILKKLL